MKRVLIVGDTPGDFRYYVPLMRADRDVGLLLIMDTEGFDDEKARDFLELTYEQPAKLLRDVTVCTKGETPGTLRSSRADCYIVDSLEGTAFDLVEQAGLKQERVAFFSNNSAFLDEAKQKGFRTYRKTSIATLIENFDL